MWSLLFGSLLLILPAKDSVEIYSDQGALTGKEKIVKLGKYTYAFTNLYHGSHVGRTQCFSTNAAVIILKDTVVFVDSGHSLATAHKMIEPSKDLICNKQRKILILTHSHSDHVFGMSTFQNLGYDVWMHKNAQNNMREHEGLSYLHFFEKHFEVTWEELLTRHGKAMVSLPDHTFSKDTAWNFDGVEVQILSTPGHSQDSVSVYVPSDKVLIAGDAVYHWSTLGTKFGGLAEWQLWINQLQRLQNLPIAWVIPGHGELGHKELLRDNITKLETLIQKTQAQIAQDKEMEPVPGPSPIQNPDTCEDFNKRQRNKNHRRKQSGCLPCKCACHNGKIKCAPCIPCKPKKSFEEPAVKLMPEDLPVSKDKE